MASRFSTFDLDHFSIVWIDKRNGEAGEKKQTIVLLPVEWLFFPSSFSCEKDKIPTGRSN